MSPAVFDMYAGCSTLDEDWAVPEHDAQICTLLAAPQEDSHPPHRRAPLTPPATERQWTRLQVRISGSLRYSSHRWLKVIHRRQMRRVILPHSAGDCVFKVCETVPWHRRMELTSEARCWVSQFDQFDLIFDSILIYSEILWF